jgi:hypothetical protein
MWRNSPRSVGQHAVLTFAQICPVKARMIKIKRIKPSPPLGQYPQLELYGQAGSAPINRRTRIINRIVPMASPFGNYFAVRRDFGCGEDPLDALSRERVSPTPMLTNWIGKRSPGCLDPFGFDSLDLFFCAALQLFEVESFSLRQIRRV